MPRILVYGAGAIGQWIGARMATAGAEVTLLCRHAAAQTVATRGLRVIEAGGRVIAPRVHAVETLDDVDVSLFDWVFITVKAFDVEKAIGELAPRLSPSASVMGFQNGVGTEDVIARAWPPAQTFVCVVTRPIALTDAPAEVAEAKARGGIAVAPYVARQPFDGLERELGACGLDVSRFDEYRAMKWSKLLLNMTANATCAILDFTPGELYADLRLFEVERVAFEEAATVMRAIGARPVDLPGYPASRLWFVMQHLPVPVARAILRYSVGAGRGSKPPSLLLEMGRARADSEIRWLNGAVVEYGQRRGLVTRANEFLTRTLEDIVCGRVPWERYRKQPDRFVTEFKSAMRGV